MHPYLAMLIGAILVIVGMIILIDRQMKKHDGPYVNPFDHPFDNEGDTHPEEDDR